MGYGVVYLTTNRVTGKSYVGQTTFSLEDRRKGHERQALMGDGWILHDSIRKHGVENFSWRVLCEANDKDELNNAEVVFINAFNTIQPNGYNIRGGGSFGKLNQTTIDKIVAKTRGQKRTPETCERISNGLKGKPAHPMSEKTKAAVSAASKKRWAEFRARRVEGGRD